MAEVSLLGFGNDEIQERVGWQQRAYAVLEGAHASGALRLHLRKRLDRWPLDILPGHRVERAIKVLRSLSSSAPPRVWAAVFKTLCNGWVTARRFQSRGSCLFGCAAEDSIEHYARCKVVAGFFEKHAGVCPAPGGDKLAEFLGLARSSSQLCPHLRGGNEQATLIALRGFALYALHRSVNALRRGTICTAEAEQAFKAFLDGAVKGHANASSLIQRVRRRSRPQ